MTSPTNAGGRTIHVRDAHIKTAAVEIKALTVSGKQVTMGVFRQLLNEDVIDPKTAELRGVPWGTVNYFPKPCQDGGHLHVVWQEGDELRRSCVYPLQDRRRSYDAEYPARDRWEGRSELIDDLIACQERLVMVASINGWRPNNYKPKRTAYYSSEWDTHLGDDYNYQPLATTATLKQENDSQKIELFVTPALVRRWQDRPELYAEGPEPREGHVSSPRYKRDDQGKVWVTWQESEYDDTGAWNGYHDHAEEPTPAEQEAIALAEARVQNELEMEVAEVLPPELEHWQDDWKEAWDEATKETKEAHRRLLRWEREYARLYESISELDQLFIAV